MVQEPIARRHYDHRIRSVTMRCDRVTIPIGKGEGVSGILNVPDYSARELGVILAHGAGNDLNHPILASLAEGLSNEGYLTLRFNFLYREKGMSALDTQDRLCMAWESAYQFFRSHRENRSGQIIAGGKSLGGRIASQMVADGKLPVDGLIFLGYPLHPPGKRFKLRDRHLYEIMVPMLFFAGTRDQLCDLELLQGVVSRLATRSDLEVIEGGDHSFSVPKSYGIHQDAVHKRIIDRTIGWLGKEKDSA